MASDVESGLQTQSPNEISDEPSSPLPSRASDPSAYNPLESSRIWITLLSGSALSLALAQTCLGYIQRKHPTWHIYFVVSLCAWSTVITLSIVTLCVLQSSIIRRLPVAIAFCGLCAILLNRFGFEIGDIGLVAPLTITIIVFFTLLTPKEDLVALTRFWFGTNWAESVAQYLQTV